MIKQINEITRKQTKTELIKKRIGDNIRKIRLQQQIEVKQVCHDIGISPATYSNIERGVTDISISRILQLSDYFSVHYSQILIVEYPTIYQFSPHSSDSSTQHNISNQATTLNNDGYEIALQQANREIQYLQKQNQQLLDLLANK